jgi:hypothetical protein
MRSDVGEPFRFLVGALQVPQSQLELLFRPLAVGDVLKEAHDALPPVEDSLGAGDIGIENRPVFPQARNRARYLLPASRLGLDL